MPAIFRHLLSILLNACLLAAVFAQAPSDLYLFQLHTNADRKYDLHSPKYLSGFNPGGYSNQPWFTPTGNLLVSVRNTDENQNDIYQLSLQTKKVRQITKTAANEYSPRIHPEGKLVTVLYQREGNPPDQQIYKFSMTGAPYESITPDTKDIGYYAWMSKDELGLFLIEGESNRLVYHRLPDQKSQRITSAVGRCLLSDKAGALVYVHKFTDEYWYIKKFNPASSVIEVIVETPGKSEDFAIAPDGTYLMGHGSKLYYFHPDQHATWLELADLSMYGIGQISRLSVSPDGTQLALVAEQDKE